MTAAAAVTATFWAQHGPSLHPNPEFQERRWARQTKKSRGGMEGPALAAAEGMGPTPRRENEDVKINKTFID